MTIPSTKNKQAIISEIQALAKSDGKSPGRERFEEATGIKKHQWYGRYWARWSDALLEAGCTPNELQAKYQRDDLLRHYLGLAIELGKFPTDGEIRIKSTNDPTFPSHSTFRNVLGNKRAQLEALLEFARSQSAPENIIDLLSDRIDPASNPPKEVDSVTATGYVYLIKTGAHFKIGRSNDFDRRMREIKTQLPDESELVHVIETDDPEGIEAYWHNRFKERRGKGEWFRLTNNDVKIIRKRKFM